MGSTDFKSVRRVPSRPPRWVRLPSAPANSGRIRPEDTILSHNGASRSAWDMGVGRAGVSATFRSPAGTGISRHSRDQIRPAALIGAKSHGRLAQIVPPQLPVAAISAEQERHICIPVSFLSRERGLHITTRGGTPPVLSLNVITPSTPCLPSTKAGSQERGVLEWK